MGSYSEAPDLETSTGVLFDRVVALLKDASNFQKRVVIALAGVPGAGKSMISAGLMRQLQHQGIKDVSLIPMDGYHYTKAILSTFEDPDIAFRRRGAPFTFDVDGIIGLLKTIKAMPLNVNVDSEPGIRVPSFDHAVQDPVDGDILISPSDKVIIIEGNYLLLDQDPWRKISSLVDERWFIDTQPEVAKDRLVARHINAGIESSYSAATVRVEENDLLNGRLIKENLLQPDVIIQN